MLYGEFSLQQGSKKGIGADIIRPGKQQFCTEEDILVFHGVAGQFMDGVQMSRENDQDIIGGYRISVQIHRYRAAAFFDNDQFCFLMPVERYVRKVQRDAAQISIIGEAVRGMDLVFAVVLEFMARHIRSPE